ncbi:hypothetical protein BLOT_000171 [Blomia tropicalis]|nr:hypothetical protein BLOT_000171 [Blomia tropicalis]
MKVQNTNSTKKKLFRLLQSNDLDNKFLFTANNQLQNELEIQMQKIVRQNNSTVVEPNVKCHKRKQLKLKNQKVYKHIDMIFGMNQLLRLIDRKEIAIVFLDKSYAQNLKNIVHKLCSVNQVYCFDIDLTKFRKTINISTLSVISFRNSIKNDKSIFFNVYDLIMKTSIKPSKIKNIPKQETNSDINDSRNQSTKVHFFENFNFYIANDLDSYQKIMTERFKNDLNTNSRADFDNQLSFISIFKNDMYFPDYDQLKLECKFDINLNYKPTKDEAKRNANKLTQKLFNLDQSMKGEQDELKTNVQFHSPNLVKVQAELNTIKKVGKRKNLRKNKNLQ